MSLGLIARADNRGLGVQTWEIYRHLRPDVTVVVDVSPFDTRWTQHFDRFPDGIIAPWGGYTAPLPAEAVEALLGCDVVFTVETPYDPTLFDRARERGVKTVIYVNPELHRHHETEPATEVWLPTSWMTEELPDRFEVVPMPVAADRFTGLDKGEGWLHVGGHTARGDRDGTQLALRAARAAGIHLNLTTQDRYRSSNHFTVRGEVADYWRLYEGMGFLVIPRRYGGLSLKVQEALANEMVVVMTDTVPNREWPVVPVHCTKGQSVTLPGGRIQMVGPDLNHLVSVLKTVKADPELVERQRAAARRWTADHSWEALGPTWREKLER